MLFEILVYSCTEDVFVSRVSRQAEKVMAEVPNFGNGFWEQQLNDEFLRHIIPVRYNELIGCIQITTLNTHLVANLYYTDKNRIVIGTKTKGVIRQEQPRLIVNNYANSGLSSEEIFTDFRGALTSSASIHKLLRNRFIDYSAFDNTGKHVDWRSILGIE